MISFSIKLHREGGRPREEENKMEVICEGVTRQKKTIGTRKRCVKDPEGMESTETEV